MKDKKNSKNKDENKESALDKKDDLLKNMSFDEIMRRGIRVQPPKDKD